MPKLAPKIALLVVLLVAIWVAYLSDLDRYFTLAMVQAQKQALTQYYTHAPGLTLVLFALLYIAVAALAIPGASALTLGAGAVFGFWPALLVVSLASTLGATLAFWLSRYLLRDFIQHRFATQAGRINRGVETEGTLYLLALRLIPVFPFFVVNALMGLTTIPTRTYFGISLLGMLPGTAAFVYAGRQLGQLQSVADVLSWPLLSALIVLGALPLVARRLLQAYRRHMPRAN